LIEKGANINEKNNNGETPLYLIVAAPTEQRDIIEFLISRGADVNIKKTRIGRPCMPP